jgi:O-antigen/teichoic acid export membrane protein
VFKNVGANWALNGLQILVLLKLAPFVVEALGRAQNGLWVTIVSMTGILSLLVLGVPLASVRYVAEHVARKDVERANAAVSTCLGICLGLGVAALAIGAALFGFFEVAYLHGEAAAGLPPETVAGARIAFLVVVVQVAMGFAMRLPYGIFDAHHDFVARNAVMAGELLLRLGLTLGLLAWKATLPVLAAVQIACSVFEFLAAMFVLRRRHPEIRFSLAGFDRSLVREILGFSVFAMLLNVGNLLAFRSDAMVIGARLDATQVTYFDIGNKFFDPMTSLLIGVGAVVMPMTSKLQATGDRDEMRRVFLKWSKISLSIVLLIGAYLLVLGPDFLESWMKSADFASRSGGVLRVLMASFLVYLPVRGVALPVLLGLGNAREPALALLAMGVLNLGLSLALVGPFGILGVAIGTAIPNVIFAGVLLRLACRELDMPIRSYLGYVATRATIAALVPLAIFLAAKHAVGISGMTSLVAAGCAGTIGFAAAWILFVQRGDPHFDTRAERAAP